MRPALFLCLLSALLGTEALAQRMTQQAAPSVQAAWLGVGFSDPPTPGILINEVIPESPAALAGLLPGDLVYELDDVQIQSGTDFQDRIKSHAIGDEIALKMRRLGAFLSIKVELSAHVSDQELITRRLVGKEAPDFSLPVLRGKDVGSLLGNRGKVVVLYFWTTRAQDNLEQFAALATMQAENLGDVEVLAITADASSVVSSYLQTYKLGVSVALDPGFAAHRAYRYNQNLPTCVVISKDGYVRHADTGPNLSMDDVRMFTKRALRDRPAL